MQYCRRKIHHMTDATPMDVTTIGNMRATRDLPDSFFTLLLGGGKGGGAGGGGGMPSERQYI